MWPVVLVICLVTGVTVTDSRTMEHRVTTEQASAAALDLNITQLEGEGCKPCTDSQKGYCLSEDLIMDHCTCDHRHVERLPYVAHTCYVPDRVQPTFAEDCIQYARLLECCCHTSLLPLMKQKLLNSSSRFLSSSLFLALLPLLWWM